MKRHGGDISEQLSKKQKYPNDQRSIKDDDIVVQCRDHNDELPSSIVLVEIEEEKTCDSLSAKYNNEYMSDVFLIFLQYVCTHSIHVDDTTVFVYALISTCKQMFKRIVTPSFLKNYVSYAFDIPRRRHIDIHEVFSNGDVIRFLNTCLLKNDIHMIRIEHVHEMKEIIRTRLELYNKTYNDISFLPRWLFYTFDESLYTKESSKIAIKRLKTPIFLEKMRNMYDFLKTYKNTDDDDDVSDGETDDDDEKVDNDISDGETTRYMFVTGGYISRKHQDTRWKSDIDIFFKSSEWANIQNHAHVEYTHLDKGGQQYKTKMLDLVPILKKNELKHVSNCMDNFDMSVAKCGALFFQNEEKKEERLELYVSPITLYTLASKHIVVRLDLANIDYAHAVCRYAASSDIFFMNIRDTIINFQHIFKQFGYEIASLQMALLSTCFKFDTPSINTERRESEREDEHTAHKRCKNGVSTMLHLFSKNLVSSNKTTGPKHSNGIFYFFYFITLKRA
jgi:hypothetical protein